MRTSKSRGTPEERELRRLQRKWAQMRATSAEVRRCLELETKLRARKAEASQLHPCARCGKAVCPKPYSTCAPCKEALAEDRRNGRVINVW